MSNRRNSTNASGAPHQASGTASIVIIMPAISSQTIAGWSCTPRRRALSPQIQMPATIASSVTPRFQANPSGATASATPRPTSEPNVPGANGASPEPKPSARQCTGSARCLIVGRSTALPGSGEVVIAASTHIHDAAVALAAHARTALHHADAMHRHTGGCVGLESGGAVGLHREQQLVIVAAEQHESLALPPGMTARELHRDRQAFEVETRA